MKLGLFNCDKRLLAKLPDSYNLVHLEKEGKFPNIDALFIDWLPRNMTNKNSLARQATVIDSYANNKKTIVLFDRYLDINDREYGYLKKFNTFFFEPAVNHREGFRFLPPWTECHDLMDLPEFVMEGRDIDLGYIGSLKNRLGSFEKYYVEFASLYPKFNVQYTASLPKAKVDEYKNAGITRTNFGYQNVKTTVLIDTPRNYEIGYLNPDVFDMMYMGVLPLLPVEHRFYHSVFSYITDPKFVAVDIKCYDDVTSIMMLDIYKSIKKVFPEMDIEYTVETIRKCVEK